MALQNKQKLPEVLSTLENVKSISCLLPAGGTHSPWEPRPQTPQLNYITGTLCHNTWVLICDDEREPGQQYRRMPAGADENSSINIHLARWQVSYYLLSKTTNSVPTDLSPVERVDAAGRAVVHQSWFGSAGCERRGLLSCKSALLLKLHCIQVHKRCYSHITGGGVDVLLHLWDMSRFPLYEKCLFGSNLGLKLSGFRFIGFFYLISDGRGQLSFFLHFLSSLKNLTRSEKWVRSFFLVSKTFSKENFCHD